MTDWIRISCAALCRIEHSQQYLLLLNRNRRSKGLYVLSPIGGGLTLYDTAILDRFDATLENPAEHDLRLMMPADRLDEFRAWFDSGTGRERTPYRELHEELVIESRILPEMMPQDVACRYLWCVEDEGFTQRAGQTGSFTHYFLEVYDIVFTNERVLGQLLAVPTDSGAAWVTEAQIRSDDLIALGVDGAERAVRVRGELLLAPPGEADSGPA